MSFCACGMPLKNGKCTRKPPVRACRGVELPKRGRFSGKSKTPFGRYEER